jgi:hypothetical protein
MKGFSSTIEVREIAGGSFKLKPYLCGTHRDVYSGELLEPPADTAQEEPTDCYEVPAYVIAMRAKWRGFSS